MSDDAEREAHRCVQAEPARGADETAYDRGYVWGYRHGLRAAAPQPAPVDREALERLIDNALCEWARLPPSTRLRSEYIADALIADGWRKVDP